MSRYVVTQIHGDLAARVSGKNRPHGVSYHVIDLPLNHRLLATYRSEDEYGRNRTTAAAKMRAYEKARAHAARLNATVPKCVYCGRPRSRDSLYACAAHSDLPGLEPL